MADGLALADGVANDGDLEDCGDVVYDDNEDLEDLGVDGELSSSSVYSCCEAFSKRELSLTPATHSQSTVLFRSKMTLALMWKDPDARPL